MLWSVFVFLGDEGQDMLGDILIQTSVLLHKVIDLQPGTLSKKMKLSIFAKILHLRCLTGS